MNRLDNGWLDVCVWLERVGLAREARGEYYDYVQRTTM